LKLWEQFQKRKKNLKRSLQLESENLDSIFPVENTTTTIPLELTQNFTDAQMFNSQQHEITDQQQAQNQSIIQNIVSEQQNEETIEKEQNEICNKEEISIDTILNQSWNNIETNKNENIEFYVR
jgi:hypothetical protein